MKTKLLKLSIPLILVLSASIILVKTPDIQKSIYLSLAVGLIIFVSIIGIIEAVQVIAFSKIDDEFELPSICKKTVVFNKINKQGIHGVDESGKVCFIHYQFRKLVAMDSIWECDVIEDHDTYSFVFPKKQLK